MTQTNGMPSIRAAQATAALTAITEYNGLLGRIEQLTDLLAMAIQNSNAADMNRLLQARLALCKKIAASANELRQCLANLKAEGNPYGSHDSSSATEEADRDSSHDSYESHDLRMGLAQAERLESAILEKQAACEVALADRLRECKTALTALGQRRGLKAAYKARSEANQARFLDNRL